MDWKKRVYHQPKPTDLPENWEEIKRKIKIRDHYICQMCGLRENYLTKLTVHHIISRDLGGSEDSENLITLCEECHDEVEILNFKSLKDFFQHLKLLNKLWYDKNTEVVDFKEIATINDWHLWVYGAYRRPN